MRVVCYTAMYGKMDSVRNPVFFTDHYKPFCKWLFYLDRGAPKDKKYIWKFKSEGQSSPNRAQARLRARYWKTHPPESDISVWVDSNISLRVRPQILSTMLGEYDLMVHRHKHRKTILEEAKAVIKLKRVKKSVALRQVKEYTRNGYRNQVLLPETGILIRKNNERVRYFNTLWWEEISTKCPRDQMSFGYCAWRAGIKIKWFKGVIQDNKYGILRQHGT